MARKLNRFKKLSKKREKATADELGGRETIASGALQDPFMKEDVESTDFLLQHKTCERKSYSITRKDLQSCQDHALLKMKMPAWRIEFQQPQDHDLAILRWQDFIALLYEAGRLK